jgi:hypothetical protein
MNSQAQEKLLKKQKELQEEIESLKAELTSLMKEKLASLAFET